MKITCKNCNIAALELRIRHFVAHVCPQCDQELSVYGFPLDYKYTVKNALNRRIEVNVHDHQDLISMAENQGLS